MNLIDTLAEQAKKNPKKIVFPEGDNPEIAATASALAKDGVVKPIILRTSPLTLTLSPEGEGFNTSSLSPQREGIYPVEVIELAKEKERLARFSEVYAKKQETNPKIALRLCSRSIFFGAMMVATGEADGMVAGIDAATAVVLQCAGLAIGLAPNISIPSSFFIMSFPELFGEKDKVLIYADCAAAVEPNSEQLAGIAVLTARNAQRLLGIEPRVAFLSFSTKGSARHSRTEKVIRAAEIAAKMAPEIEFDGELQADTALVLRVAAKKAPESKVAGKANILIFPDLDSGNIAYKLSQYLAGATAYGPVVQGFARPINDLSRGATAKDVYGVAVITALLG